MIPVVLVDDEYMNSMGMKQLIDWSALGFTVTKTFTLAEKALADVIAHPPGVIITDMNMPNVPGPEFVRRVRAAQPDTVIIVLSGYGDFDYVRASLQSGALDYLRKPVDPDELTAALAKAKAQLAQVAKRHAVTALAKQQVQQLLVTPQGYTDAAVQRALHLTVPAERRVVAILNPQRAELTAFLNHSSAVNGYFWQQKDAFLLLEGDWPNVRHWLSTLPAGVGPARRPVVISPLAPTLADLHDGYIQVLHAAQRTYFYQSADGLMVIPESPEAQAKLPIPTLDQVTAELAPLDFDQLTEQTLALYDVLTQQRAAVAYAKQLGLVVLMAVNARSHHRLPHYDHYVSRINAVTTVAALTETLQQAITDGRAVHDNHFSASVQRVVELIQKQYQDPLQLTEIADDLHLSPIYLGQLFKKETGATFSQYLVNWRIERAKAILRRSDTDIGQIAELVGYQNNGYFYKVFKKQVGVSPRVYRAQERQMLV